MDSSSSRAASMKPVILKAGFALIVSATGLIFARFMTRREDNQVTCSTSNPETSLSCRGDDDGEGEEEEGEEEEETGMMGDSETRYGENEHEILRLRAGFEELKKKEYELEMRFLHYCDMKDKESMLVELKSMLSLEKARIDFFGREVSAMEEESKRVRDWVIVCMKLVEKIQFLRSENSLLQSKAKKLTRRTKELSSVMKAKNARMNSLERILLRTLEELETKNKFSDAMEHEIEELRAALSQLQKEKNEFTSESSNVRSEMECEVVTDYKRLLEEYKNLKREGEGEVKEIINLRWRNACLRHAVMRYGLRDQESATSFHEITLVGDEDFHAHMSLEDRMALEAAAEEHREPEEHQEEQQHHESSRRKKLLKRLKRLVEWHEKGKSKNEERCFGRHSLTVEPEEEEEEDHQSIVLARRSCSSV